jgi:hypothetical protein
MPDEFNAEVPSTVFTTHHYREPYRSVAHPDIDALRKSLQSEPVVCAFPSLRPYLVNEQCPQDAACVVDGKPLFRIHDSIFDDLTLIGITYFYAVSDLGGIRTLLHAWTRLLSGESIDAIGGMDWDAFLPKFFQQPTDSGFLRCDVSVRGYWHQYLIAPLLESVREMYDSIFILPGLGPDLSIIPRARRWMFGPDERRLIHVPKAFLDGLRGEIMDNLKLNGSTESVDRSDALLAWWFKASYFLSTSINADT